MRLKGESKKLLKIFFSFFLRAMAAAPPPPPLQINAGLHGSFRFVAYGDTRFTDPANTTDTNPEVRRELVRAIAAARPAFISFGGDIPLNGFSLDDWKVYDQETAICRERKTPLFPPLPHYEF